MILMNIEGCEMRYFTAH